MDGTPFDPLVWSHGGVGETYRREACHSGVTVTVANSSILMKSTNVRKLQISREIKSFLRGAEGDEF
jgi:hypothetical protein